MRPFVILISRIEYFCVDKPAKLALYSFRRVSITEKNMPAPPLVVQTTYAELLERSPKASFDDAFAD